MAGRAITRTVDPVILKRLQAKLGIAAADAARLEDDVGRAHADVALVVPPAGPQ